MSDALELEKEIAIVRARAQAFEKSPLIFTLWDILQVGLRLGAQIAALALMAQCICDGCVY